MAAETRVIRISLPAFDRLHDLAERHSRTLTATVDLLVAGVDADPPQQSADGNGGPPADPPGPGAAPTIEQDVTPFCEHPRVLAGFCASCGQPV